MTLLGRPERIGPYRLEARLGSGGMGEVYTAWDERLGRRVAIKLIRADAGAATSARFRLEARAVAALNHPAIVQIYDIVNWQQGDALVLELVEGSSLDQVLAGGPLPIDHALRLGVEVASALAAAHARGIVHRDLKAANVMLTADGSVKVLDFGIAKRLGEDGEGAPSTDGGLVGTPWAMSPEQARGLPVDHRSDLFALGVLLYEAISGRHPFRGGGTLEILERVCTRQPPPLAGLRPEAPAPLAALIDRLLEKEPARRPASAGEALATLGSLVGDRRPTPAEPLPAAAGGETLVEGPRRTAGTGPIPPGDERSPQAGGPSARPRKAWRWKAWPRKARLWGAVALLAGAALGTAWLLRSGEPTPAYVAVPAPQLSPDSDAAVGEDMAYALRTAVLSGLLALEGVSTPAPEQVDEVRGSPAEVARALAADELLGTRLRCDPFACEVTLERVEAGRGALLWTQSFTAPAGKPFLLAEALRGYLKNAYPERRVRRGVELPAARPEDYQELLALTRAFDRRSEAALSLDDLLARLAAIRRSSPRFLEALILEAQLLRYRFGLGRDPLDLETASDRLALARRLAPQDPRPLSTDFEVALSGDDLAAARTALGELERLQPGDPALLAGRARLLEREGETDAALAAMRRAVKRLPSWPQLFRLADMEYRLGESDAARRTLEDLLVRLPGSFAGRSLLAQIELLAGNAERAATLYSALVAEIPRTAELSNLSIAEVLLGRYGEAREHARLAFELQPQNAWAALSLADATLLGGDRPAAETLYQQILELAAHDPARGGWPLSSVAAQALAHLGRREEAVERIQPAVLAGRDNPQAAFEASLVFALVGDDASALVAARRALGRNGVARRWFSLPWFDSLRGSPELTLLTREPPS